MSARIALPITVQVPSLVTIRLARHGGKKTPFYHVTVAEKSAKRDGRFVERIGFYNPVARGKEEKVRLDAVRFDYWLNTGARPTARVRQLAKLWRKQQAELAASAATADAAAATEAAEAPPAPGP